MSREKQIEEMANDIAKICPDMVENGCGQVNCVTHLTLSLHKAGYRKQSEGEWSHGVNDTVKCSICRRRMPKIYCMNFCPNCGAKMGGGAE